MPQLRQFPITASDIQRFLSDRDDFAFEMRVLRLIQSAKIKGEKFSATHGGHYTDSVTGKSRQYDIRAHLKIGRNHLRVSVECKQLTEAHPLVVSRVPRDNPDSHHYLVVSKPRDVAAEYENRPHFQVARSAYGASLYRGGVQVGKSCFQLGLAKSSPHEFVVSDSEVYEKWSQALASAEDLVWSSIHDHDSYSRGCTTESSRSVTLPLLVIPDGTLWAQDYTAEGDQIGTPKPIDHCEFALWKTIEQKSPWLKFVFTHLHILTFQGLKAFLTLPTGLRSIWPEQLFPSFDGGNCLEVVWSDAPQRPR
mgnify:CR=1 FL=1